MSSTSQWPRPLGVWAGVQAHTVPCEAGSEERIEVFCPDCKIGSPKGRYCIRLGERLEADHPVARCAARGFEHWFTVGPIEYAEDTALYLAAIKELALVPRREVHKFEASLYGGGTTKDFGFRTKERAERFIADSKAVACADILWALDTIPAWHREAILHGMAPYVPFPQRDRLSPAAPRVSTVRYLFAVGRIEGANYFDAAVRDIAEGFGRPLEEQVDRLGDRDAVVAVIGFSCDVDERPVVARPAEHGVCKHAVVRDHEPHSDVLCEHFEGDRRLLEVGVPHH